MNKVEELTEQLKIAILESPEYKEYKSLEDYIKKQPAQNHILQTPYWLINNNCFLVCAIILLDLYKIYNMHNIYNKNLRISPYLR